MTATEAATTAQAMIGRGAVIHIVSADKTNKWTMCGKFGYRTNTSKPANCLACAKSTQI